MSHRLLLDDQKFLSHLHFHARKNRLSVPWRNSFKIFKLSNIAEIRHLTPAIARTRKKMIVKLQWNLYKADTIGAKKCVRFIEMSALQRFFLRQFDRKAKQSVPRHTVRLIEVSALQCVRFIEIPLYLQIPYKLRK